MSVIPQEQEREELRTLLASGIFAKAPNVQSFLEFVADKYFAGVAEEVKEYQIALEALHRSEGFNPQSDTIVRVTAHSLRKRLDQYYSSEGADHPVHIQLPTGRYMLRFVPRESDGLTDTTSESEVPALEFETAALPIKVGRNRARWAWSAAVLLLALIALGLAYRTNHAARIAREEAGASRLPSASGAVPAVPATASAVRFLAGENRRVYSDPSGDAWTTDQYCKGGDSLPANDHRIQGTEESELFRGGRKGNFHCRIPVPKGSYQIRLFFAETEGTPEASRQVAFNVNGGELNTIDVVDVAGGNDTATERVLTGIHPQSDGTVHLDFTGDGSFVNAVELLPAPPNSMLPIRIHSAPVVFRDSAGNMWLPDRFYTAGRRVFHPEVLSGNPDAGLFQWERYGHFHYSIPVVAKHQYTVTLYFTEAWFGAPNGGPGGAGNRVFDVYGDGTTLLSDFDILQQQKSGIAKVSFHHVKPTAQDIIDLYFAPTTNYALVNAIEIEDEI